MKFKIRNEKAKDAVTEVWLEMNGDELMLMMMGKEGEMVILNITDEGCLQLEGSIVGISGLQLNKASEIERVL